MAGFGQLPLRPHQIPKHPQPSAAGEDEGVCTAHTGTHTKDPIPASWGRFFHGGVFDPFDSGSDLLVVIRVHVLGSRSGWIALRCGPWLRNGRGNSGKAPSPQSAGHRYSPYQSRSGPPGQTGGAPGGSPGPSGGPGGPGGDGGDGRGRRGGRGGRGGHGSSDGGRGGGGPDLPPLACPFYKYNCIQHLNCLQSYNLTTIDAVKQHLVRQHKQPIHCPICRATFDSRAACNTHISQQTCRHGILPVPEGVTEDQCRLIRARRPRGQTEDDHWYTLWGRLFPSAAHRPDSPRVQGLFPEMLAVIRRILLSAPSHRTAQLLESHVSEHRYLSDLFDDDVRTSLPIQLFDWQEILSLVPAQSDLSMLSVDDCPFYPDLVQFADFAPPYPANANQQLPPSPSSVLPPPAIADAVFPLAGIDHSSVNAQAAPSSHLGESSSSLLSGLTPGMVAPSEIFSAIPPNQDIGGTDILQPASPENSQNMPRVDDLDYAENSG